MRPPEVFVRELTPEEGNRLKSLSRRAKYLAKRQRADRARLGEACRGRR
jgi:hypothetical protein